MSKVVKILDAVHGEGPCVAAIASDHPQAPVHARHLRTAVAGLIRQAAEGHLPVHSPPPFAASPLRGAGHMHLHAEVFFQMTGLTRFTFPHGDLLLPPGQVLVVPPKLLHDEWVGAWGGEAFCNLVVSADSQRVSIHLAHESRPGVPSGLYLETFLHPDARRIEGWLRDAASPPPEDTAGLWPLQQRALLLSALTGVARLLEMPPQTAAPEPALLGKLRMLIQNRMGEVDLTVAALASDVGCSADYLSHLYSQLTGEHLWQVVLQQRLERAARLLTESEAAVKEVAWCSGFASASYFIRCFRQRFGLTPKAYRQQAQGQTAKP
jgi:AraC-like DNA-binding protein